MPRQEPALPVGSRRPTGRPSHDQPPWGRPAPAGSQPRPLCHPTVPLFPRAGAGGARRSTSTGRCVPEPPSPEHRRPWRLVPAQRTTRALPVVRACWLLVLRDCSAPPAGPNRVRCWVVARPRSTPRRPTTARPDGAQRGRGTSPAAGRSAAPLDRTSAPATADPGVAATVGPAPGWSGAPAPGWSGAWRSGAASSRLGTRARGLAGLARFSVAPASAGLRVPAPRRR